MSPETESKLLEENQEPNPEKKSTGVKSKDSSKERTPKSNKSGKRSKEFNEDRKGRSISKGFTPISHKEVLEKDIKKREQKKQ